MARTATAAAGGVGKVTEKWPLPSTFTSESSTVTREGSLTMPVSVTGAPLTAGRVGPVILMCGRSVLTVKVQLRRTGHGTNGWSMLKLSVCVPSDRSRGRKVSVPSPTCAWSMTSPSS